MTVPNIRSYTDAVTCDGVKTVFDFTFKVFKTDHLVLEITETATGAVNKYTSGFSVVGLGVDDGGTLTYPTSGSPIAAGHTAVIRRVVPYTQEYDLSSQGRFNSEQYEEALDLLAMQLRQLADLSENFESTITAINAAQVATAADAAAASASETNASNSATAAAASEAAAATSESAAAASETAASSSETAAAASETAAANSATASANSATASANSATAAAASETAAAASETAAANSATAAAASETAAAASAAAAEVAKIEWQGDYDGGTTYAVNDAVLYSGSSYICTAATTGNLPTDVAYWDLLSSKGDQGIQGIQGPAGVNGHAVTVSTSQPSGTGSDGDIWVVVPA